MGTVGICIGIGMGIGIVVDIVGIVVVVVVVVAGRVVIVWVFEDGWLEERSGVVG